MGEILLFIVNLIGKIYGVLFGWLYFDVPKPLRILGEIDFWLLNGSIGKILFSNPIGSFLCKAWNKAWELAFNTLMIMCTCGLWIFVLRFKRKRKLKKQNKA